MRFEFLMRLAEETDAGVIVVSEETHTISLAIDGKLRLRLDPLSLRSELVGVFLLAASRKAA